MQNIWQVGAIGACGALFLSACGEEMRIHPEVVLLGEGVEEMSVDVRSNPDVMLECTKSTECTFNPTKPVCDVSAGVCVKLPHGPLIAWGDGSIDSVEITPVFEPKAPSEAPDLAFHPTRDELWILNRRYEVPGVCTKFTGAARCRSLSGFTTIVFNPGKEDQSAQVLEDKNSWHFMRRPPALAMGANETFATCGEAATGNHEDNDIMYMGPTLWSSDLAVYAQPSGGNGSHLDMLHVTPWCMGIAHERDNIYWLFNGHVGSIDKYDFKEDHGPGKEDHSDGMVFRYVLGEVARVPNVPSHMKFHHDSQQLYIADTGHARIVKLDTSMAKPSGDIEPIYEDIAQADMMSGATLTEVVAAGVVAQPSGLVLHKNVLYVSDHLNSRFYAFDLEGNLLRVLDTNLPPRSIAGFVVGPDERIWFSNMQTGTVYRIDPK